MYFGRISFYFELFSLKSFVLDHSESIDIHFEKNIKNTYFLPVSAVRGGGATNSFFLSTPSLEKYKRSKRLHIFFVYLENILEQPPEEYAVLIQHLFGNSYSRNNYLDMY